jgi:hypothetical protein
MTTDSGGNRWKDHVVIKARGIWVRLRTGMWITTRDQRGWHLETKTKASLSKKLDKRMILWLVWESAIKVEGRGVSCWGGSDTMDVWQWSKFTLCTTTDYKWVYKNSYPLKMESTNMTCHIRLSDFLCSWGPSWVKYSLFSGLNCQMNRPARL